MVQYITFGGKKYPVQLGIYSMQILQNQKGIDLQKMDKNPELWQPVLWAALQMGARIEEEELDLKEANMDIVLDQCFLEFAEIFPTFFDDDVVKKLMEVEAKVTKKAPPKKRTSPKSTPKPSQS